MDKHTFDKAIQFMFSDIEREVQLARATKQDEAALRALGVMPGGGNFLAALGLLCYTEFGGKLKFDVKRANGTEVASENFNRFFDLLGPNYEAFRKHHNVYDIFRCGLAHEYYVKENCTIYMLACKPGLGLGIDASGHYFFVVESYFQDLRRAFKKLKDDQYGS